MRLFFFFASLLLLPAIARAEPTAQERETARNLMNEGDASSSGGDHAGALRAYRAADAIMNVPTTRYAVGHALAARGELVEARDVLLSVARIPVASDEPVPFADARDAAAKEAFALSKRIPSLRVVVAGPEGAYLVVNGKRIADVVAGTALRMNPGSHRIEAHAPGAEPVMRDVVLTEAETKDIELKLEAAPVLAPAPKPAPTETPAPLPMPVTPPAATESSIHVLTWVGIAIAGAGLVTGGITGGLALAESSDLDEVCSESTCPQDAAQSYDRTLLLSHVSTTGFAVAGAGAVLALVGLAFIDGGTEVAISPTGLVIRGSF